MTPGAALAAFDGICAGEIDEEANWQWRIARRPQGIVRPEDFTLHSEPIPQPAEGEVLLRTHYLGLAPVMRFYMQGTASTGYAQLGVGDVIHGRGVAQVVKSRHPDWRESEMVQGQLGWQTWKASRMTPQEKFFRMPKNGLPAALGAGVLGMTGLSAHAGLFACGNPKPEDRMVLSGAAGGVGSMVSQMAAKVVGCDVVGIAGGPEKCDFIQRHGCAAAIDYKSEDIAARLDDLRADGIDLYFDNVGGETLSAVLDRLRLHARIVLCGSISEYTRSEPFGLTNYTRLRASDARMQGFFVYNHLDRWDVVMEELASWIADGRLKPVQDIEKGFAAMPRALANLYYGANVGVQCCSVRGEPEEWL
ncbi:NADP-dependent oxidoreductase [Aurantiacibacter aquimixticola]|uniref:NADP-dependent oxidoreductase n=1 Tax=Aurantiacibacter aquimixticola TaxID=1958945 RepID=A0A419RW78_9SPHN|nr:NADP-dependent oxidoreductase [Aurantiacibacter aquimixticola]RJY10023.1 NADP-dependent oxidoreductase [Aurantiacibacter aquimixticola]